MSNYETTVKLPSRGVFYPEHPELAEGIVLRMMNTNDEKKVFGSTSDDVISTLIKSCVTNIEIDPDMLVAADRHYLLMKLRIHTYGDAYHIEGECPHCGAEREMKISLDDIPIYELPEDFEEPFEMTLPLSKKKVGIRVLRTSDVKKIRSKAKKMAKEMNVQVREVEYLQRLARQIVTIDGEDVKPGEADKFVKEMLARDSAYIKFKLDEIKLGYDDSITVTCPECGEEYDAPIRMTGEFFRPRFD